MTRPVVADSALRRNGAQERPELARGDAEQVLDAARDERADEGSPAVERLAPHARGAAAFQCGSGRPGTGERKHGIVVPMRLPR